MGHTFDGIGIYIVYVTCSTIPLHPISVKMTSTGVVASVLMMRVAAVLLAAPSGVAGGSDGLLHIPSSESLAHCPSSCGDVEGITYPFGIGPGCFRQGFELTCDNTSEPSKLFLGNTTTTQVLLTDTEITVVKIPTIGFNITMNQSINTYTTSWESPVKGFGILNRTTLLVVGCALKAELFDADTNEMMGSCVTLCLNDTIMEKQAAAGYCVGIGCCTMEATRDKGQFG